MRFCARCGSKLEPLPPEVGAAARKSGFKRAFLWTTLGGVVLSQVSFGILLVPLLIAGMIAAYVNARKGRKRIAAGILAGIGVGLVAFVVSCFAIIGIMYEVGV